LALLQSHSRWRSQSMTYKRATGLLVWVSAQDLTRLLLRLTGKSEQTRSVATKVRPGT
jgi:hypothetical protein